MIPYKKHILDNGLTLIVHRDKSTPVTAVSVIYKVGSRNENPHQTGLAHLFEHLMFGGSKHVKDFDAPIQSAGGENNAFTNNDLTNFYCILPGDNLDTAFWLESDRMASLQLNQKKLDNQKSVVIEEFKETCLNEPYGDVWHHISELAYQEHPYRWPVIGMDQSHISDVTLEDAKVFYKKHYHPSNAILTVAGPLTFRQVLKKVTHWFGDIPPQTTQSVSFPVEKPMLERRFKEVYGEVPSDALYICFPMSDRLSPDYYITDLVSDILAGGRSSRLYQQLVKEKEIFTYIDAYVTGTNDQGLLLIEGKISPGSSIESAEAAIWDILEELKTNGIPERELRKLKNKVESTLVYSEISVMAKAINLGIFESMGDADLINREVAMYRAITAEELQKCMQNLFNPSSCAVLYYRMKEQEA